MGVCVCVYCSGGTGLLAMMAAKAMGRSGSVSCCESYLPMFKLLRRVLRANGFQSRVALFNKRSDELVVGSDLASRADVVVSEILDSELLGEGLIPTLQHAHDSLLVPNPLSIPHRAATYAQLVESSFLSGLCDLRANELGASDGICLDNDIMGVESKQYAFQCDAIEKEIKLVSLLIVYLFDAMRCSINYLSSFQNPSEFLNLISGNGQRVAGKLGFP